MGYVDLRRRREERKPGGLRHFAVNSPHLLLATGFVLGLLSSPVFYIGINSPDPFTALLLAIVAATLLGYVSWLLLGQSSNKTGQIRRGETATHGDPGCGRQHYAC